jgi:hypothetical protein
VRELGTQLAINVVSSWIGALALAGVGWLVSPSRWLNIVDVGVVVGTTVGTAALVAVIVFKRKIAFAFGALGFGFSCSLLGIDLIRRAFGSSDNLEWMLGVLIAIQGLAGIGLGWSLSHRGRRRVRAGSRYREPRTG